MQRTQNTDYTDNVAACQCHQGYERFGALLARGLPTIC